MRHVVGQRPPIIASSHWGGIACLLMAWMAQIRHFESMTPRCWEPNPRGGSLLARCFASASQPAVLAAGSKCLYTTHPKALHSVTGPQKPDQAFVLVHLLLFFHSCLFRNSYTCTPPGDRVVLACPVWHTPRHPGTASPFNDTTRYPK